MFYRKWYGAAVALTLILGTACGPKQTLPAEALSENEGPPAPLETSADDLDSFNGPIRAATPGIQVSIPGGIPESMVRTARTLQEVEAAARVTLGQVTIHGDAGPSLVAVVAVNPVDFRPLAPAITADAAFVWRGLADAKMFLAHEEHRRLGIRPGDILKVQGPAGRTLARVGGVAANGVPNWGGAMVSLGKAAVLGLGEPTLLLVAPKEGVPLEQLRASLERRFPGVPFATTPRRQRTFLSGLNAERFFSFSFVANPNGFITPDPAWVATNIRVEQVPILGSVRCHRLMLPQLRGALQEIVRRGLSHTIDPAEYAGCYVPRFIGRDPTKPLSMHAWGLAVDINAVSNPLGAPSKQDPQMVAIFESWGFRWGGHWTPPDAHHFELAALVR